MRFLAHLLVFWALGLLSLSLRGEEGGESVVSRGDLDGAAIYRQQCASCHGAQGEGMEEEYDEPLHGTRSLESLTRRIERTMPEDEPELCVGDEAAAVARYLYETFYTAEARGELEEVRLALARLTAEQYLQTTSDLLASFQSPATIGDERGLRGRYYDDRRFNRSKRRIERVDPIVS